ncbi:DHH family phosphoesterase [Candidatus Soleaferrea massiliensis]|uniref:DHH family phosphoesterase n=1 Tax=Candidatus Soleaferrea massiliensis TaxID=1470354 RepID=UPI00058E62AD|nr:bifunctional oligoribonuclease/PAP phosphatase NrnA [Candidatus Soleaferrea massiliensis]
MKVNLEKACELLQGAQNILIFSHQSPDGDTLGSSFALKYALNGIGKKAAVVCHDSFPAKYGYFIDEAGNCPDFEPDLLVSVDVADESLLGKSMEAYRGRIDLAIDHHPSNSMFAAYTYLEDTSAATAEMIYLIIERMGIAFDKRIANCIYTGIVTDTGCFKFSNTSARTHIIAAKLIELDTDYEFINKLMFETKSLARIQMERMVLNNLEFYFDNRCAVIHYDTNMLQKTGVDESELDGLAAMTRQIEGVELGLLIKEKPGEGYKISVRTGAGIDASKLCSQFGGGGHARAAGCTINKDFESVKQDLLKASEPLFS